MGWLSDWTYRIAIIIDDTNVDSNLTNFPVMLNLSAASGQGDVDVSCVFDELAQDANRKKIAVTTDDGETQCYVEIELYDDANEQAILWVKVPSILATGGATLYLYYDSEKADNTDYVGDTGDTPAKAVWDDDFVGVWHMAQDPNGDGADAIKDSTSNQNDGTPSGSMTTADLVAGPIGKAIDFDGSDDFVNAGSDSSLDVTGNYTFECILTPVTGVGNHIICGRNDDGVHKGLSLRHDSGKLSYIHWIDNPNYNYILSASTYTSGNHYVVSTFESGVGSELWVDGSSEGTDNTTTTAIDSFVQDFVIGAQDYVSYPRNINGIIDEVRISKIARSDAWIKATYYSNWDALITFGAEEGCEISANTATLIITPQSAAIEKESGEISANTATLIITPHSAILVGAAEISANTVTIIIAPQPATVIKTVEIFASTAVLIITPQSAIIKAGRFKGKYVFTLFPHWIEPPEDSFSHKNDVFMPMVMGLSYAEEIELYSKYRAHFKYTFTDKEQIGTMNNIFDNHLGMLTALWFPSFKKDFVLTSNIGESDTIINIEDTEYEDFYPESPGTGRYIFIYVNAVTWFARKITGATSTTLVMEEPLGEAVLMSRVKMISILYLGRFDIDEIEWTYITPDVATTDLYFIELPDEYVDLP